MQIFGDRRLFIIVQLTGLYSIICWAVAFFIYSLLIHSTHYEFLHFNEQVRSVSRLEILFLFHAILTFGECLLERGGGGGREKWSTYFAYSHPPSAQRIDCSLISTLSFLTHGNWRSSAMTKERRMKSCAVTFWSWWRYESDSSQIFSPAFSFRVLSPFHAYSLPTHHSPAIVALDKKGFFPGIFQSPWFIYLFRSTTDLLNVWSIWIRCFMWELFLQFLSRTFPNFTNSGDMIPLMSSRLGC